MNPVIQSIRRRRLIAASLMGAGLLSSEVNGQEPFPSRPLLWVVPFAAGGGGDTVARVIARHLAIELGQSVVVENRPGGNSMIAAQVMLAAPPDGHAIMSMSQDSLTINPHLHKLPYDVGRDLAMVAQFATFPFVLVARKDLPVHGGSDLVAFIKASGPKGTYATLGAGSVPHIGMEMIQHRANVDARMTAVSYKGAAPASLDLIAGRVDLLLSSIPAVIAHVKDGRLKAVAVTGLNRSALLPQVPTLHETGLPGFDFTPWAGAVTRKATPKARIMRLQSAFQKVLDKPELQAELEQRGLASSYLSATEFTDQVQAESRVMAKLIKDASIKVE